MALSLWNPRSLGAAVATLSLVGFAPACGTVSGSGDGSGGAPIGSGGAKGITYVKASNAEAGDFFGVSATFSADAGILVVGAPGEASSATGTRGDQHDNSAADAGAAYVYVRTERSWVQEAYLKASSGAAGDAFGSTAALSADGNTLAIGAPHEASAARGIDGDENDDTLPDAGAVYVFVRRGTDWEQQAYLKASNADVDDLFGLALDLSADGDVLAVGAEGEDSSSTGKNGDQENEDAQGSGAVYVFAREGDTWRQRDYLKASNTGAGDGFGASVALAAEGTFLAVGALREDSGASGVDGDQSSDSAPSAGAVYLLRYDGSAWQEEAYLKPSSSDGSAGDNFGSAVSLSVDGGTLAVGAVGDPSASTGVNGDAAGDGLPYAGAVYVFGREGTSWTQQAYLKASNTGAGDEFGYHLHLSAGGATLAVGAALEASDGSDQGDESAPGAGAVYVFSRVGGVWDQTGFIKAPSAEADERFGWSMALSGRGDTLAVGSTRESSAAVGIDGEQGDDTALHAGAVYVYELNGE